MPTVRSLLALSLFVTACASSATPRPAAPRAEPSPTTQPPAPPAGPAITRIDAGGWPGSNTHEWGSRHFELRGEPTAREVRIHDAIDFQGVGMEPGDMEPTRHTCTPWEPLPPDTAETAEAIRTWYRGTQPAPPPSDPKQRPLAGMDTFTFGRGMTECG